jgi:hypothetical protein
VRLATSAFVSGTRPPLVMTSSTNNIGSPGGNGESAAQHQSAILLFRENEAEPQLPATFLANDQTAHGRRKSP